jgi:hypothetical protein
VISAATSTIVAAGRTSPKTSACTAATSRQRNIGYVDAGPDHVGERGARLLEGNLDAAQSVSGLGGDVARRSGAGCPGHCHVRADAHRARVTDHRFEFGSRRDNFAVG